MIALTFIMLGVGIALSAVVLTFVSSKPVEESGPNRSRLIFGPTTEKTAEPWLDLGAIPTSQAVIVDANGHQVERSAADPSVWVSRARDHHPPMPVPPFRSMG